MYVCMYVCRDVSQPIRKGKYVSMLVWLGSAGLTYIPPFSGAQQVGMNVWMYVCMYVCM